MVFGFRAFEEEPVPGIGFNIIYMKSPYFKKALYKLPIGLYFSLNSDKTGNFINRLTTSVIIENNIGYVIDGEVYDSEGKIDIKLELGPSLKMLSLNV